MIRLRLFGAVDLQNGAGADVAALLVNAKPTALLALLAISSPGFLRRDRLIALLWPELDEPRARNALSKAIHLCRRTLGEDVITTRGTEDLGLNPERWWCDVNAFTETAARGAHAEALELYRRGELLDGYHLPEATDFERWLDAERARLKRIAVESGTAAADAAMRIGDLTAAGEWARILCELNPYDEVALRRRIEILDRLGDRAGAVSLYQQHKTRLMRDLELEPSPETNALISRLRERMPAETASGPRSQPSEPETALPGTPARASLRPRRRAIWGISVLVAAAASMVVMRETRRSVPSVEGRILVAAFDNRTGDTTLTVVGEMLADWLTMGLSRTGLVDVVDARARVRGALAGSRDDSVQTTRRLAALARETGATTLVRGIYSHTSDSLRVVTRILHADAARVIQALEPVTGPAAAPLEVVEKVRQQVLGWFAAQSDHRLAAWATAASRPPTYAAYAEYVAGLHPMAAGDDRAAIQQFERALALDSSFVAPMAWLLAGLGMTGNQARADSLIAALERRREELLPYDRALLDQQQAWRKGDRPAMLEASRRMVRLAPGSPDANWWHGFAAVTTNHFAEAIAAFDRVEAGAGWTRDATFASLFWPTRAHHQLGDYAGELARVRRYRKRFPEDHDACAAELRIRAVMSPKDSLEALLGRCTALAPPSEPEWPAGVRIWLAAELRVHGAREEAVRIAREAAKWHREQLEREPDTRALREGLGRALMEAGEWAEAREAWEKVIPKLGGGRPPRLAANAGVAAARMGDIAAAERMLELLTVDSTGAFFRQRARILASLNRRAEAVAELRKSIDKGIAMAETAHTDIGLELLRGYPPYETLVRPRR